MKADEKKRDSAGLECNVGQRGKKPPKGKKAPSEQAAKRSELMQTAAKLLQRDPESVSSESVQVLSQVRALKELESVPENPVVTSPHLQESSPEETLMFA